MSIESITFASIIGVLTVMVGISVKIIGFPDQFRKNYVRKSTEGLSSIFFVLSFMAYLLWTIHGALQKDMVLIIGQGIGIITTGMILLQIFLYRKK